MTFGGLSDGSAFLIPETHGPAEIAADDHFAVAAYGDRCDRGCVIPTEGPIPGRALLIPQQEFPICAPYHKEFAIGS
jgi:hypothetical protein